MRDLLGAEITENILLPSLIASFIVLTGSVSAATLSSHSKTIYPLSIITVGEYVASVQAETLATVSPAPAQISTATVLLGSSTPIGASVKTFFQKILENTAHFFEEAFVVK